MSTRRKFLAQTAGVSLVLASTTPQKVLDNDSGVAYRLCTL